MEMATERFKKAIRQKHIPILTLDNRWHRILEKVGKSREMQKLEKSLNELVARQGELKNQIKEMKQLKSNLMDDIVKNMGDSASGQSRSAEKKVSEDRRLIEEINERMDSYDDELLELPGQIDDINMKLMLLTMEKCYGIIQSNVGEIESIGSWIKEVRVELKKNILKKQHMELTNVEIYSYMQGVFGPEVVDLFDINYDIELSKQSALQQSEAIKEG